MLCCELRRSYIKIALLNDTNLFKIHYKLIDAFLKKYPADLQEANGFLSNFVRPTYNLYLKQK